MPDETRIPVVKRYQALRRKLFCLGRSYEEVRTDMISSWDRYLDGKHKNEDLLRVDLEWMEAKFDRIKKAEQDQRESDEKKE